jgi:hypothetical protein
MSLYTLFQGIIHCIYLERLKKQTLLICEDLTAQKSHYLIILYMGLSNFKQNIIKL